MKRVVPVVLFLLPVAFGVGVLLASSPIQSDGPVPSPGRAGSLAALPWMVSVTPSSSTTPVATPATPLRPGHPCEKLYDDTDHDSGHFDAFTESVNSVDYHHTTPGQPGVWRFRTEPDQPWQVFGYAAQEDAAIYSTPACAR